MGSNYYTRTFIGEPAETAEEQQKNLVQSPRRYQDFYWSYHQFRQQPLVWEQFNQSLSTVRGFHLVLVTEWLNSASKEIEDVLGWKIPPKRVSGVELMCCFVFMTECGIPTGAPSPEPSQPEGSRHGCACSPAGQ